MERRSFLKDGLERKRERLLRGLRAQGCVSSPEVERAFLAVPREEFIPEEERPYAYVDSPLSIACSQTISAPSMIAIMLEVADLRESLKVLEIGTGSGYNAALIEEIVGPGNVVSIERHSELVEFARSNLVRLDYKVKVVEGDGTLGYDEDKPYDRIISTAGSKNIPPYWVHQTNTGGKIVAPLGDLPTRQILTIAEKIDETRLRITTDTPCAFVPLIGLHGWQE